MSEKPDLALVLAQIGTGLAAITHTLAKLTNTLLDHETRLNSLENGLEEELSEEEEDHPPPRKGQPTQVLLGTSKAARKAYQQKKNP